jgi:hypothetical protein
VRNLVVDLCFLVEGKTISELPVCFMGLQHFSCTKIQFSGGTHRDLTNFFS